MGQRAHRIKKIVYAEGIFFIPGTPLGDAVMNHEETNDFRNQDGGGNIEIPLRCLKDILENSDLNDEDKDTLGLEIIELVQNEKKDDDDYIVYDIF